MKKQTKDFYIRSLKNRINFLTLFAFSTENWSRPKIEVSALMSLLDVVINDEANNFIQVCPKEMLDKLENPITLKKDIKNVYVLKDVSENMFTDYINKNCINKISDNKNYKKFKINRNCKELN